ncbi:MAG TPA: hydroxymethylbilane synthase [Fibrobacteraceae bacterium]|nr:hydroxymethylbilane synthase [Fibrobacteraceae bacterium]
MKRVRIASRASALALAQSHAVANWLRDKHPGLMAEVIPMTTQGDEILDRKLDQIGGKGLFIKELEQALLEDRADIAVHSAKDLPAQLAPGLALVAASSREDARDVLVSRHAGGWDNLPDHPVIGSSSARRSAQLYQLRPDVCVEMLRGNVQTRLRKLREGQFDAIVLAAAGLKRLGLDSEISSFFTPTSLVPAVGQGILAIEARENFDPGIFHGYHNEESWICLRAERAAMLAMNGDCGVPLGVYAQCEGSDISLTGFYGLQGRPVSAHWLGPIEHPEEQGQLLAELLLRSWEAKE